MDFYKKKYVMYFINLPKVIDVSILETIFKLKQ